MKRKDWRIARSKWRGEHDRRARFWEKVDKRGPKQPHMRSRCWVWSASLTGGYGVFGDGTRVVLAHRMSWEIHFKKKIPRGKFVLHKCDHRSCVRPTHLYVGTQRDNVNDAVMRGRVRGGGAKGEKCHLAKLTAEQVTFIRSSNLTGTELARMFNVTHQAVYYARSKKTWKHL